MLVVYPLRNGWCLKKTIRQVGSGTSTAKRLASTVRPLHNHPPPHLIKTVDKLRRHGIQPQNQVFARYARYSSPNFSSSRRASARVRKNCRTTTGGRSNSKSILST